MTFPNPCPVCGAADEHAAWAEGVTGSPCTFCPHPGEPGHGTGCCCGGRARRLFVPPLAISPDLILGTGPRHDRTGTGYAAASIGDSRNSGWHAKLDAMTWTGCNGQMCARDCGPGHSARLWVSCRFAVGGGHSFHLKDEEITALRDALEML